MFPQPRHDFLDDTGMVSVEYAVGMFVAIALAGALLLIVRSESVRAGLTSLIERALNFSG
jgi:hypothetical protein